MVPLESSEWNRLQHAYGAASDIPDLLRRLVADPRPKKPHDEPWESLWSSLCHQGDVYTASYAAVPHIVQIALNTTGPIDFSFFLLPARVEIARQRKRGPEVPQDLEWAYFSALRSLIECASRHAADEWDGDMVLCVLGAIAAAKGQSNVADVLTTLPRSAFERLDEDLIDRLATEQL